MTGSPHLDQETASTWYAVYTKPRQEQVAFEHLKRQGFEVFLPLARNPYQRYRSRRASESLFPRYLFIAADTTRQSLGPVRSTRGVVGLVRAGAEPLQAPADMIDSLKKRRHPITGLIMIEPSEFRTGEAVRVFDGPMAGTEGIFKAASGTERVLLMLRLLGRDAEIEVDPLHLQRTG